MQDNNEAGRSPNDTEYYHDNGKSDPRNDLKRSKSSSIGGLRKTKELVKFAFLENDASIIDRVSRILFPAAYLAFNIFYWSYYTVFNFNGV